MNIFDYNVPKIGEDFTTLFENKKIKIVRIVSSKTIENKQYIQDEDEFVMILEGEAKLKINNEIKYLNKGEHIFIPAKTPHEVLETKNGTLWIAIHFYL
ncbi:MAG: cupin domain-containing protein [Sulfurovaceae bacterium]|nr:cupin domain-containing protein [Sulfurovaceae bacterium]MDD5548455.1 cupin domain-containing protein [Sulfurovaceae bacterium]